MVNFFIMLPRYRIPRRLIFAAAADLLRGSARSFSQDARLCVQAVRPPICYLGREQLPADPCLITINHYRRPGFPAWWLALGVSAAVGEEIHWLVTSAWTFPGRSWANVGERVSRVLLKRLARIYAFSSMPPMPPRPEETQARAQAVRRLIESVRRGQAGWIGIAPEGRDAPEGVLQPPPPGSGRFLLLLAGQGLLILPVGIYEAEGICTIRFGEPYRLEIAAGLSPSQRDARASQVVMQHLAELLPPTLRGPYGGREQNGPTSPY